LRDCEEYISDELDNDEEEHARNELIEVCKSILEQKGYSVEEDI
jgi:hypothetical protein